MSSGYCTMHKSHVLDEAECYFCKEQKPCNNWLDTEPEPKEMCWNCLHWRSIDGSSYCVNFCNLNIFCDTTKGCDRFCARRKGEEIKFEECE